MIAPALSVLLGAAPRRCPPPARASSPSRWASRASALNLPSGPLERLDRIGQVHQELAVLPAHDVGPCDRLERRGVDGVGDGLGRVVRCPRGSDRGRAAPTRGRMHLHHARTKLRGRAHDAHAVGAGEVAQHPALVLHAVLHADRSAWPWEPRHQLHQRLLGVLALHRQQDDGVRASSSHVDGRVRHRRDGQGDRLARCLEDEARLQGAAVLTPCNQRDVVAPAGTAAPRRRRRWHRHRGRRSA